MDGNCGHLLTDGACARTSSLRTIFFTLLFNPPIGPCPSHPLLGASFLLLRYRVVVSVPGFDCVGLRVGGRRVAVVSPGGEPLLGSGGAAAREEDDGATGGCIELGPSLWPSPESRNGSATHALRAHPSTALALTGGASSNPRPTALVVEAELVFKPTPVSKRRATLLSTAALCSLVQIGIHRIRSPERRRKRQRGL